MLVLSRRSGESIVIGDDVTVTVVQIGRGRVRIGVAAPSRVPVHRVEVLQANLWPAGRVDSHVGQADSIAATEPATSG